MTPIDRAVHENIQILFSMLPAVRDGNADAIHDSRVATRRLRAAVPLAWAFEPDDRWAEPLDALRTLGQSFGRARDLDVALERLTDIDARIPLSARRIALLKREVSDRQGRAHRRLIKTIEDLPLGSIRDLRSTRPPLAIGRDRRRQVLDQQLTDRAGELRDAIERASGVYFPNRTHQVRVTVKKLRYLLELVPDRSRPSGALKRLKRAQESLGDLHDQQTLMDLIEEVKGESSERDEYDAVLALLAHDRQEAFTEYLDERDRLQRLASDVMGSVDGHVSPRQIVTRGLLVASVVMAAPAARLIARQRDRMRSSESTLARADRDMTPNIEHDRSVADSRRSALMSAVRST